MIKITKKISILLFSLFMIFCLISCEPIPGNNVYNIEYYIDGEKVEILPNTYLENQYLILPTPKLPEGTDFNGWYDNALLSGERIEQLDHHIGDLKLYGETIKEETSEYTITYYVNGEVIDLAPKTYKKGEAVNLPTPILNEGETFNGWYLNSDFTGEKISKFSGIFKNIDVYGEIVDAIVPPEHILEKVFSYTSFTFELKCEGENYDSVETFYIDNHKYHQSGLYGDMYLEEIDNISYCYFEEDGKMYYMTERDDDYNYFAGYLYALDLTTVDFNMFIKSGDYYTVASSDLDEAGLIFTGYEEDVQDFKMYIVDDKISKINIETIYEGENYSYEITFSDFGTTTVEIPDAEYYYENSKDDNKLSIEEVYSLSKGEVVTVEGIITGIYGNNFYLSDNEKGILVYMSNNTEFNSLISLGSSLSVTGEVDIYKTVHQIKNVTSIFTVSSDYNPKEVNLDDVKQTTLSNYVNDIVSVEGLQIVSLPSSYPTSGSDVSFKCSYDGAEITIFISKHLDSSSKNSLYKVIKSLEKGSIINLTNAHVSYYDNYQLVLTSSAEISEAKGEVTSKGLVLSSNEIQVEYDTELNEILNKIKVYEKFSDGSKVELLTNDYTVDIPSNFESDKPGTYSFVYKYNDYSAICKVVVKNKPAETTKVEIEKSPMLDVIKNMGYDDYTGETYGVNIGLPSIGEPKVLVIPIAFTNAKAPASMVSDLEKAFFGTSADTGWESLKSYYYKSSYGQLNISGTVLKPYNTGKTTSYYDNLYKQYLKDLEAYENYETDEYPDSVEYQIIKEVLEYYDNQIDYSDYDYNDDGYIDSIYLIYTKDYDESDDSFWWAYTNEYYTDDYEYYDNVEADFYMFMSYEFFFDELNGETVKYNAETLIHETGHLLGLDDYYDYDGSNGPDGGIGGGDMMDYNVGDHNAYSKLLLGWIDPYVVSGTTTTINLESFGKSGDAVFIFKDYEGTFFDEYYVIDFYTPDGLNDLCAGDRGLFSQAGIRIYHVDATLNEPEDCWSIYELTKFNNSYTNHLLIKLIEADGRNDIASGDYSENSDLFETGESYTNIKWYDNSNAGFTVKVNYIENGVANITIEYK